MFPMNLSIGDEVRAEVRRDSNKYIAVIRNSEYLIRNDDRVLAGDSVAVRVVGPSSVIVPAGYDYDKEGLPGELFAIVDSCPDHYPSKVRCIEPPFVGEQCLIEELESEVNDIVPILPLDAKAAQRAAICTKPSLWPGERVGERSEYSYSDELVECFDNSETVSSDRVEKIKGLIAKTRTVKNPDLRLTQTDFIAPKAIKHVSDNTDSSLGNNTEINKSASVEARPSGQMNVDDQSGENQQKPSNPEQQEPSLTGRELNYTTTRRRQRDAGFAKKVKSVYNEKCAVCGKRRVTPDGKPEVEAAHIYAKSEGGVDHVRNGLALCKFHYWAFDNGWISVTEDYSIIIAEYQNREGYNDLKKFDSEKLYLPDKNEYKPHQKFIREHQRVHGFD